jgi:hypothetical protein
LMLLSVNGTAQSYGVIPELAQATAYADPSFSLAAASSNRRKRWLHPR